MEPDFYSDAEVISNPRAYYDMMRARGPVVREPHHGTLIVTGYDAAMEVLNGKDDIWSSACSVVGPIPGLPFEPMGGDIRAALEAHRYDMPWGQHLANLDGKTHAEQRALVGSLLTYKRLKANEDYLYGLADRLIDGFAANGNCNLMPDYAHATTTYAISDLLGIPMADRAELLELIGAPPSQVAGDAPHKVGPDPLIFMKPRFDQYLRERQANPSGDLLSDLANARFKDGTAPAFDVLSTIARFLFGAGQDTTSRLIAMAVLILAEDAALQDELRAEPAGIPDFIEEVLRYDAPVKVSYRLAVVDTHIGDLAVPAGTLVNICLTGASNDPDKFPNPDHFDAKRPGVRDHLAFSRGQHGCIGAPLGRMETRIAIERLLARVRTIRIDEAHHGEPGARQFRFEPTYSFRSLSDLYIRFVAV